MINLKNMTDTMVFSPSGNHAAGVSEKKSAEFYNEIVKNAQQDAKVRDDRATTDQDEKAFAMVGPNAPQNVKEAWMEAAKEVRANGMGIQENGMMSHISQMMVQRLTKMIKGETTNGDVLGSTVASAMRATKQALYDLEHPLADTPKSIEVQKARIKEREFYTAFLEKLQRLSETGRAKGIGAVT